VIGGALVDSVGWRAVFLVNVPVGIVAIVLTAIYVPESRAARARRIDPLGQLLVVVALATLTYSIIEAPSNGWLSAPTLALFAVSAASFASLVVYELRHPQPLIEIGFFRSAPFSGASAIAVCVFAALGGFLFLNTLYLQDVRGVSPLDAGLYTLPMAGVMFVLAPISGRIVGNRGTRLPLLVGSLGLIAGAALMTQLTATTPFALLIAAYVLFGIGFGFVNPPITNTAVSGMPPSQAGVAAGVASTSRQIGSTLGVAVLGALAGGGAAGAIGAGFPAATHVSWWILVALGFVVLGLGLLTTTAWAQQTASKTAERFREDRPPNRGDAPEADPAELAAR
jgi:MFS family permease